MKLTVHRYSTSKESTLGVLMIDGLFQCYTLEDENRIVKVLGETRIPSGKYEIELRSEGGHHIKYKNKYGSLHKGMLHIKNVPNFKWILIHTGNDDSHTAGCLLVGNSANNNQIEEGFISNSVKAYREMYAKVSNAILKGEIVTIEYYDDIC